MLPRCLIWYNCEEYDGIWKTNDFKSVRHPKTSRKQVVAPCEVLETLSTRRTSVYKGWYMFDALRNPGLDSTDIDGGLSLKKCKRLNTHGTNTSHRRKHACTETHVFLVFWFQHNVPRALLFKTGI